MPLQSLQDLLVEELRDLYHALTSIAEEYIHPAAVAAGAPAAAD